MLPQGPDQLMTFLNNLATKSLPAGEQGSAGQGAGPGKAEPDSLLTKAATAGQRPQPC